MEISFHPPCRPWSVNERRHWASESRDRKLWKAITRLRAEDYLLRHAIPGLPPSNVKVFIPFYGAGRRDPHNYTGTVVKAIIDGLVAAGCWTDDTAEFVTVIDPVLVETGGPVLVEVSPR